MLFLFQPNPVLRVIVGWQLTFYKHTPDAERVLTDVILLAIEDSSRIPPVTIPPIVFDP